MGHGAWGMGHGA
jgi:hypothetical protein